MSVLRRILAGEAPVIAGDGSQSFDFVHVADVADANVRAMASDVSGVELNVGSGTEVSVAEIVRRLIELTGSDLEPEFDPSQNVLHAPPRREQRTRARAPRLDARRATSTTGLRDVVGLRARMRVLVTGATGFVAPHLDPPARRRRARGRSRSATTRRGSRPATGSPRSSSTSRAPLDDRAIPAFDAVVHLAQANVPFPDGASELFRVNIVEHAGAARPRAAPRRRALRLRVVRLGLRPRRGRRRRGRSASRDDFYAVTKRSGELVVGAYRDHVGTAILRFFAPVRARPDRPADPGSDRAGPRRRCRDAPRRWPAADDADLRRRRRRGDRPRARERRAPRRSTSPVTRPRRFASSPSASARSSGASRCSRTPAATSRAT